MYNSTITQNPNYMINGEGQDRFFGGFLGPFILGGITGGLVAPFFINYPQERKGHRINLKTGSNSE